MLTETLSRYKLKPAGSLQHDTDLMPNQQIISHATKCAEPADQNMFQGSADISRFAGSGDLPAQKLARVAIDDQRQRCPTVFARSDAGQVL